MIRPILQNIADYVKANTNNQFFKNGYFDVTLERKINREGDEQTYPTAWTQDGKNDGLPLMADKLTNYFYLRMNGPAITTAPTRKVDSCNLTIINTYPMRFVAHIKEEKGGNYGDRRAIVFQQLLGNYAYAIPVTSVIERVVLTADGYNADKYEVFEEETEGVDIKKITQRTSIIAVDFNMDVSYTPAACPEDDLFCAGDLLDPFIQVAP